MNQVIAMHGWSGDSNTWLPWSNYFTQQGWLWENGERGYGLLKERNPCWQNSQSKDKDNIRAVIGHSLGPHLVKEETFSEATHIVFVCSFASFLAGNPKNRTLKKALKRMQEVIGTKSEKEMLNTFLKKACYPNPINEDLCGPIINGISIIGRENLKEDLELLINTKNLPKGIPSKAKALVIEADEDQIIDQASKVELIQKLSKHLDEPPTHWRLSKTGHSIFKPQIISQVKGWLEESK